MMNKIIILLIILFLLSSCVVVKQSDMINLNDSDMTFGQNKGQKISNKFHNYREGSSGNEGINSEGGCGCN